MQYSFFTVLGTIILAVSLGLGGWLWLSGAESNRPLKTVTLADDRVYSLEEVQTAEEAARGLGQRDSLCERCAMLFSFTEAGQHTFWMKDMRFPLDIVWLRDGSVVHIERNIPSDSREVYQPPVPANQVLEFNAGEAVDLQVGQVIRFSS